jgi:hypothetical protein
MIISEQTNNAVVGQSDSNALLGVTRFAPTIMLDGREVQPAGWVWVLAFALAGVPWAIAEAETAEFRSRCADAMRAMSDAEAQAEIASIEQRIARIKARLTPNA